MNRPRLLVIDDECSVRDLLKTVLTLHGFEVVTVADGDEACRAIITEYFDLVLCDILLPGKSGLDVLKEVRARQGSIPFFFLTSQAHEYVKAMDLGADEFILKPFDFSSLEFLVRTRLHLPLAA